MNIFPDSPRRVAWTTCLAALAIVGVLFMHGFDAPALDLLGSDQHDSRHDAGVIHGAIGLCVFVITAVGLIATRWSGGSRRPLRATVRQTDRAAGVAAGRGTTRLRLFELCVMRA